MHVDFISRECNSHNIHLHEFTRAQMYTYMYPHSRRSLIYDEKRNCAREAVNSMVATVLPNLLQVRVCVCVCRAWYWFLRCNTSTQCVAVMVCCKRRCVYVCADIHVLQQFSAHCCSMSCWTWLCLSVKAYMHMNIHASHKQERFNLMDVFGSDELVATLVHVSEGIHAYEYTHILQHTNRSSSTSWMCLVLTSLWPLLRFWSNPTRSRWAHMHRYVCVCVCV